MKNGKARIFIETLISLLIILILMCSIPSAVVWLNNYREIVFYENLDSNQLKTEQRILVVFGAGLRPDGKPSPMLANRLDRAYDLYQAGISREIILSGDYTPPYYNEVGAMQEYLINRGVAESALKLDPLGFSTFATVENLLARQEHKFIFVSQKYHLPRMLEIAKRLGIDAIAVPSSRNIFPGSSLYLTREVLARGKDLLKLEFYLRDLDFSPIEELLP
ncbi:MAG: YdcF family protein [Eubacteriales bacterium]|nr:YdcF family protein [Eubacteriales bacterium]